MSEQEYLSLTGPDSHINNLQLEALDSSPDGTVHPHKGRFSLRRSRSEFPSTGAIQLTGLFPNPGKQASSGAICEGPCFGGNTRRSAVGPAEGCERNTGQLLGGRGWDPNNTIRFSVVKVGDRKIGSDWVIDDGTESRRACRIYRGDCSKIGPGMPSESEGSRRTGRSLSIPSSRW